MHLQKKKLYFYLFFHKIIMLWVLIAKVLLTSTHNIMFPWRNIKNIYMDISLIWSYALSGGDAGGDGVGYLL